MSTTAILSGMAKLGQRGPGSGTTLRFALLLLLLLMSSVSMTSEAADYVPTIPGIYQAQDPVNEGCLLAGGVNPEGGVVTSQLPAMRNSAAFRACYARYGGRSLPWWTGLAGAAVVGAAALGLYWVLPLWKGRRRRVARVEEINGGSELSALLSELVVSAGLDRQPRFVIDPAAATTSAVVFGRPRRYTVCLHGGLVARRESDAAGFRAVIFHELAHIRNRDVGVTYATVALWRVYLMAALLPYAAFSGWELFSTQVLGWHARSIWWPAARSIDIRDLVLSGSMVLLINLARADILRSREIYADLDAVRWGADPLGWHSVTHRRGRTWASNALFSFAELWRTHPTWELRKYSLTDPSALFGVPSLQMFLIGAAAAIADAQFFYGNGTDGTWPTRAEIGLIAGLTAGISVATLWRAATQAVLHDRPVPSGLRAGLWLGAGLTAGELLPFDAGGANLLPARPVFLLPVLLIAIVAASWTTEYAELSIRTTRGPSPRLGVWSALAVTGLLLAIWLNWWHSVGWVFTGGWPLPPPGAVQYIAQDFKPIIPGHYGMLSAITVVRILLSSQGNMFLVALSLALWLLPLLTWAKSLPAGVRLPPVRRNLLSGLLGGILCWAATAMVMAYMHSWHVHLSQRFGIYYWIYNAWLVVAVTAAIVAMAAWAGAVNPHFRLISALSVGGITSLIGLVGIFLLTSTDGCAGPLATLGPSCGWRPGDAWSITREISPFILGVGMLCAAAAASLSAAVSSLLRMATRDRVVSQQPIQNRRGRDLTRRVCVAVLCSSVVILTVALSRPLPGQVRSPASSTIPVQQLATGGVVTQPSSTVRKLQLSAWFVFGGGRLLRTYTADVGALGRSMASLATAMRKAPTSSTFRRAGAPVGSVCLSISRWVRKADTYFPVPDPRLQRLWSSFLQRSQKASTGCRNAIQRQSIKMLIRLLPELTSAIATGSVLLKRITAARRGVCASCR